MKKLIKSYLAGVTLLTAMLLNGCDIFESFQFGLPIKLEITTQGAAPAGAEFFCFTDNETYQQYQDDIKNISFVAAYLVTVEHNNNDLRGDVHLRLYEGTNNSGKLLFEHVALNLKPSEHDSTNAYKIVLTNEQITDINASLAEGGRCFYGEYQITNVQGATPQTQLKVKIDALFNVEANLD